MKPGYLLCGAVSPFMLFLSATVQAETGIALANSDPAGEISDNLSDVALARGATREINFQADEGTWMSLDVSSDGQWLAFDLLGQIYRLPITGGVAQILTQNSGIAMNYHPRISPDGASIAFISDRGGQDNLWVMDTDGYNARAVTLSEDARYAEPAWTPDGSAIIVTRRAKTAAGFYRTADSLWRFPRAGGEGEMLVDFSSGGAASQAASGAWAGNGRAQWPAPTRDGKYLYFQTSDFSGGGERRLMRLNLADRLIVPVTAAKASAVQCCGVTAHPSHLLEVAPEVSPDGRWLAFARKIPEGKTSLDGQELNGRTTLWLRDLHTGEDRMLMDPISNTLGELHAAWQTKALPGYSWMPDSKSLVLTQGGKLRRVFLTDGHVETIPFSAHVHRTISEQARGSITFEPDFPVKAVRWPATSPDGAQTLFEAVGQLWLKRSKDAVPASLTIAMPDAFQLTPSWSPDGRWIAFATSSDTQGGHVWKVRPNGQGLTRLTREPGRFLYPRWDNDGNTIVVSSWPPEIDYDPAVPQFWQIASIPANGGPLRTMGERPLPATISLDDVGGYWSFSDGVVSHAASFGDNKPRGIVRLPGISIPGIDTMPKIAVSPDGRHIAVWYLNDIYLLEMPPADDAGEGPVPLDPLKGSRLTTSGGYYPAWIDNDRLEFAEAGKTAIYSLASGTVERNAIDLRLPRTLAQGVTALTDARIIAGTGQGPVEGTILVQNGRILCAGACDISDASRVVPLGGRTVIPGLVDVHAHHLAVEGRDGLIPQHRAASATYLANGVTTVFDPSVDADIHSFSTSELIEAGRITGPRTFSTGTALSCGAISPVRSIDSFEEALHQVDRVVDLGAPSVKDYKQCTRTQRTWLAEAARTRGVSLTSEGSDYHYILGLVMTGHTGWEHSVLVKPTYSDFARFVGQAGAHYSGQIGIAGDYPDGAALEYWLSSGRYWFDEKAMLWHPWQQMAHRRAATQKPINDYGFPFQSLTSKAIVGAGGYVATGGHGEMRGLDTHFEMWALAQSMAPLDVLSAGSIGGAHFLGLEKEIGSIEPGKLADLVVLNGDPLSDIQQTANIAYVMKDGILYDGTTLDQIWPAQLSYGPRPWRDADIMQSDTVPDGKWDGR